MARLKSLEVLETDRRIGQCLGVGLSIEKTAEHLGIHANTVRKHLDGENRQLIFTVKAEVETLLAAQTAKTVVSAAAKAEDRIKSVFDRSLVLTEKAISKAEDKGDDITLAELMEIHNKITVWSSKFAAQEAPKTLKVDGAVQHNHEVSGEVWDRFEALSARFGMKTIDVDTPLKALPIIDIPIGSAERH